MAKRKSKENYGKEVATAPAVEDGKADLDGKNSIGYWLKWLKATRNSKACRRHIADCTEAWKEFEKDVELRTDGAANAQDRLNVYPIYWSSIQTMGPAFYARTPEVVTQTLYDINDGVGVTGAIIVEYLGKYLVENANFDEVFNKTVEEFINSSKVTTQVIYEADTTKQEMPVVLKMEGTDPASAKFVDPTGVEWHEPVQMMPPQMPGQPPIYFGMRMEDVAIPETQKIYLSTVTFDEVLHTPNAKTFNDITEIAYYFVFTKEEAKKKFGEDVCKNYPWKVGVPKQKSPENFTGADDGIQSPDEFMDGWECYCKNTKKVYWVSESYANGFLKEPTADPYQLKGFFPSPAFILQNRPRKNLFPRPAYIHLRPSLQQLHLMYERVFGLIDAVRRRAIVDGNEDIINLLNGGDLEFVSAKSIKSIIEKGGLDKMIWYIPVKELVEAIKELCMLEDRFKANIYEWFGVPDILRGVSDPIEALGTQEIKAGSAHDRFKVSKKDIQKLARDSIEMMIDLALKVFDDEKIKKICGFDYLAPIHQQRFGEALNFLRNDSERIVRVDIDTDSMTFVDQGLKTQRINLAIKTALDGMRQATEMMQFSPKVGALAMKAVLLSLQTLYDGKKFQDDIRAIADEMIQAASQPKEDKGPDPEIVRAQIQQQIELLKSQTAQQIQQAKGLVEMERIRSEEMQANVMAMIKMRELQARSNTEEGALAIKEFEATLKGQRESFNQRYKTVEQALEAEAFQESIGEKVREEERLDRQQALDAAELKAKIKKENKTAAGTGEKVGAGKPSGSGSNVTINVRGATAKK